MPGKSKQGKQKKKGGTAKSNILKASIKTPRVKGRGGFVEDIGKNLGGWLGSKAASLFTRITGIGDYSVRMNTLTNPSNPPILSNTRSATRMTHREYVCDILSSSTFTVQSFPINIGLSSTFPWGSGPAQSFEQYRLHGAIFEFKSMSAVALNSTNTALGAVIMATEYDSSKPNFPDKRTMENYVYSTSSPPSVSAMHPIECARDVNVLDDLYVRTGTTTTTTTDIRFSDLGKFQIATVGMQASGVIIGELWVTYDVELLKPRMPANISTNPPVHYVYDSVVFPGEAAAAPTASALFESSSGDPKWTLRGTNVSPVTLESGGGLNFIYFYSPGRYWIGMTLFGTTATLGTITATAQSGSAYGTCSLVNMFVDGTSDLVDQQQYPGATLSSASVTKYFAVEVTTASPSLPAAVGLVCGTLPSSITLAELMIATVPSGFLAPNPNPTEQLLAHLTQRISRLEAFSCEEIDEKVPQVTPKSHGYNRTLARLLN